MQVTESPKGVLMVITDKYNLIDFYNKYYLWLATGAVEGKPFTRHGGLTVAISVYCGENGRDARELRELMRKQTEAAGKGIIYPFGSAAIYLNERIEGTGHMNEERRQWIKDHATVHTLPTYTPDSILTDFYRHYWKWVSTGAVDYSPYSRGMGICGALAMYCTLKEIPSIPAGMLQLQTFREYALDVRYPFGGEKQYRIDNEDRVMHLNQKRLDWVKARIDSNNPPKPPSLWIRIKRAFK